MNVIDRRAVRTAARTLVVPAALAVLAVCAPTAAAHTELETSRPGADASLAGAPPRVTLNFSDAMTGKYAKVAVTTPDGASAATGEPRVSGRQVTLALDPASPAGRYTVGYRVVSADGHPVAGSYTFTIENGDTGTSPSPRTTEAVDVPVRGTGADEAVDGTGNASGNTSDEGADGGVTLLIGAGVLAVAVAAAGAYVTRRRRAGHGR